jgi:tetratricopeptide (TPR) repeat protein
VISIFSRSAGGAVDRALDQKILSHAGRVDCPRATAESGGFARIWSAFPTRSKLSRPAGKQMRTGWVSAICGFLLLAVGLVFGQTLGHEFLAFDDNGFVYENPFVAPGLTLSGLWWALTDGPFGEWYPLTPISHMLDCQLYGLEPAGHHLTNVLLHGASSVLLFLVLLRMTDDLWPSAWVAAVFAVHPLHVSTVAWVAERREVLAGLFFMLTLGAYVFYTERPSLARYLAVVGLFALGLMSKPILVTVPFLLLLLDGWPLDRFRHAAGARPRAESGSWLGRLPIGGRLVVEKVPLMALSAASCAMMLSTHASDQLIGQPDRLSLATRVANALVSYAAYIGQSFYPVNLSPYYPHLGTHLPIGWAVGSLILLVAITAVAAFFWRRLPCLLVGWLWFLGMLVPVLGLVGTFLQARADNYTYLSQIGLSIALAWGAWSLYQSRQSRRAVGPWRWTLAAVSAAAVVALAAVAWHQTSYWRNTEAVWTRAAACTTQNPLAHYCLAGIYAKQGRLEEAIIQSREALATYSIARKVTADTHVLLAECLTAQGKTVEALANYEQAIRILPTVPMFHTRLAIAFAGAGKVDQAADEFREALRLDPAALPARVDLSNALLAQGKTSEAVAECRDVLEKDPRQVRAIVVLASALAAQGQTDEAISSLERASELEPSNAATHFRLGRALYDRGQSPSAVAHLNEAIQLQPDDAAMLWQTAWILATSPDASVRHGTRAVELATRAIQLSGGQEPRAIDALAAALAETNKFSAAIEAAEHASAIALARSDDALADAIDQRTRLYRQGLPYREPASPRPAKHAPPAAPE